MEALKRIESCFVVLPEENIDTDQIIPAQFLTTTSREGLGRHAFHHWRYDENGQPRADFPFNQPENAHCQVLVAGHNFGCGSSREHAPWALLDMGLKAVISSEIADIFRNNSLKNGLLAIVVPEALHQQLLHADQRQITIDLESQQLTFAGQSHPFEVDGFARHCMLNGLDPLGFLLEQLPAIEQYENQHG